MKIIKNMNELARKAQNKAVVLVSGFIVVLVLIGWFFSPTKSSKATTTTKKAEVKMDGTTSSQFSQKASQKAIEEQQREIKDLHEQLKNMGDQLDLLQSVLNEKNRRNAGETTQDMQARIEELEHVFSKQREGLVNGDNAEMFSRGITTTNFSYMDQQKVEIKKKTVKDYVPPGTFAKAVLLSGADTNAGVNGQTDTTPITMRILDNGTLPNGKKSSLKGCFVTTAAFGDASSERGQIRLQRLSCVRKASRQILDVAVEGTINDMGGSDGIRGHVIMRNNKLIWNAGVSGMLSGFGSSMQQTLSSQSISPLGITNAIKSGKKAFQYGAFGGANTALGKLADYYIKLADMYHPIVQIHAGSEVNIVFLKGFSLTEGLEVEKLESNKNGTFNSKVEVSSNEEVQQNLMQTIRNAQLGQEVDFNDNGNIGESR